MKKLLGRGSLVFPALLAVSVLAGCSTGAVGGVALGEEFTLAIGESVEIDGEDLSVSFEAVTGDSRCPSGVQCVWAGEASCQVKLVDKGNSSTLVLVEPGATDGYTRQDFGPYQLDFQLLPYPRAGEAISQSDYRLKMVIGKATGSPVPPVQKGNAAVMVEISSTELGNQKNITKTVELTNPVSLILTLPSNQTTGYQWTEKAIIRDNEVISQYEHNYVSPQASNPPLAGEAGKEVWTFKTLKPGASKITVEYARPWEAQNVEYTVTIDITVR